MAKAEMVTEEKIDIDNEHAWAMNITEEEAVGEYQGPLRNF